MTEGAPDTGRESARSARTKKRIVEAGHECIRASGIRRTTMEEVAEKAGVSRAALYRHYPNKQALVDVVLMRNGSRIGEELNRRLARKHTLADKCAVAASFGLMPPKELLLLELFRTDRESLAELLTTGARPFLSRATDFWEPHVRAAQEAGEVRRDVDTRQAAEWVARSLFGLASTPLITIDASSARAVERFARTFIVAGLVAR